MTRDKSKFSTLVEYKGGNVVITANNAQLPITHIGKATCIPRFSEKEAQLQQLFHVPSIKKTKVTNIFTKELNPATYSKH